MSDGSDTPANGDDRKALFRAAAVRHNTPGLFGEVRMAAPPATWVLTALVVVALGTLAGILAGLSVEGVPLWRWLLTR